MGIVIVWLVVRTNTEAVSTWPHNCDLPLLAQDSPNLLTVFAGNFNTHRSLWSVSAANTTYWTAALEQWIVTERANMATPQGLVTFTRRAFVATLDLTLHLNNVVKGKTSTFAG